MNDFVSDGILATRYINKRMGLGEGLSDPNRGETAHFDNSRLGKFETVGIIVQIDALRSTVYAIANDYIVLLESSVGSSGEQ